MALSFLYRFLRRAIEIVRIDRLDAMPKDAEILVLRHQLACSSVKQPVLALGGRIERSSAPSLVSSLVIDGHPSSLRPMTWSGRRSTMERTTVPEFMT